MSFSIGSRRITRRITGSPRRRRSTINRLTAAAALISALAMVTLADGRAFADEAPTARRYHRWLLVTLDLIEQDLPAIRHAAARVRELADVPSDTKTTIDPPAFIRLNGPPVTFDVGHKRVAMHVRIEPPAAAPHGDHPHDAHDAHDVRSPRRLGDSPQTEKTDPATQPAGRRGEQDPPTLHLAIAGLRAWQRAGKAGDALTRFDVLLDHHGPAQDGWIPRPGGRRVVPVHATAALMTYAVLQAEIRAAQGRATVHRLRRILRDLGTAGWPRLARGAERLAGTIIDGGRVLVIHPSNHPAEARLWRDWLHSARDARWFLPEMNLSDATRRDRILWIAPAAARDAAAPPRDHTHTARSAVNISLDERLAGLVTLDDPPLTRGRHVHAIDLWRQPEDPPAVRIVVALATHAMLQAEVETRVRSHVAAGRKTPAKRPVHPID